MIKQRDASIDFLRFIGLSLVILAHIPNVPFVLLQIRCFDVPLMAFVAGLSFGGRQVDDWGKYIFKRAERLVVPVWIFLVVYFILLYLGFVTKFVHELPSVNVIIESFLLLDGIGYIWIIRVFLLVMLATPIVVWVDKRINNDFVFFIVMISLLVVQECLVWLYCRLGHLPNVLDVVLNKFGLYVIPYSVMFAIGSRSRNKENKKNKRFLLLSFCLAMICLIVYVVFHNLPIVLSPKYKYPPQLYFIAYGLFISLLLWTMKSKFGVLANNRIVSFLGQNTIWIYLWHIFSLQIIISLGVRNWIMGYLSVYLISVVVFYVQYCIINYLDKKKHYEIFNYFKG